MFEGVDMFNLINTWNNVYMYGSITWSLITMYKLYLYVSLKINLKIKLIDF